MGKGKEGQKEGCVHCSAATRRRYCLGNQKTKPKKCVRMRIWGVEKEKKNDTARDDRVGGQCGVWRRVLVVEPEGVGRTVCVCGSCGCGCGCGEGPEGCKRLDYWRVHLWRDSWPNSWPVSWPNRCGFGARQGQTWLTIGTKTTQRPHRLVSYQRRRADQTGTPRAVYMERPQIDNARLIMPSRPSRWMFVLRTLTSEDRCVLGFAGVGQPLCIHTTCT